MAVEYTLSVNKFNRPKKFVDKEGFPAATQILITRLILLEPGTVQSHPDMGVGIVSRYRYSNVEELDELERDIQDQVRTYLPDLYDCTVNVTEKDRIVTITLLSKDMAYVANFNKDTFTLSDL